MDTPRNGTTNISNGIPSDTTESGELERPAAPARRKIDCGDMPEIAERRTGARGGRRRDDVAV